MIVNPIFSLRTRPQNVHQSEKVSLSNSVLTMFNYQESTQAQTVLNETFLVVVLLTSDK